MLPEEFFESLSGLPGFDAGSFRRAMHEPPAVSLKLNRRKCADVSELGYGGLRQVPWCPSGFYLDERPKFTLNPLLHAGVFYVQDASSMIHESIVARVMERYSVPSAPVVLDMCAAPGGKTTSMINALPDGSLVVANEVIPQRARILRENMLKWGYPDTLVTSSRTSDIASLGETFDIIAVDAPCSGEGMMRKDPDAVAQWGPGLVAQCSALQREILADAIEVLNPGGFLIYSTCTFNRTENEENVAWLVETMGLEPVDMEFPGEWGIGCQMESDYPALRFMPHLTRGEGLFAAVLRKPGDSRGTSHDKVRAAVAGRLRLLNDADSPSAPAKSSKKNEGRRSGRGSAPDRRKPVADAGRPVAHAPLSSAFVRGSYPEAGLDLELALSYLRHEAIRLPESAPLGYVVVTYDGHPLGFVKNIGNRANNLYPAEWRIRNL